jgi:hypothetical protein
MKIQGPKNPISVERAEDRRVGRSDEVRSGEPVESGAVVVAIDRSATQVMAAAARLSAAIGARLEAVRAQLRDRSYVIDYDRLSECIVDDELARSWGSRRAHR